MGQDVRSNLAMSHTLLLKVFWAVEVRIEAATTAEDRHRWVVFGTYGVISYVMSLRGAEGLLLDLGAIREEWSRRTETYLIMPLRGKIKGEDRARNHLLPCAKLTKSGINVEKWLHRLVMTKREFGFRDGPAISDIRGKVSTGSQLDECFHDILEELFALYPEVFPPSIKCAKDILIWFHSFRTWRRTAATQALSAGVSVPDINTVNRWCGEEKAKGKTQSLPMHQKYAAFQELVDPFFRFTFNM